ncbi:DNA repair protein RecO [Bacillus carboniphilus]|uniref:DNA repair protein RecO n=1 Tax=Bacillus carboniphilus TaxID=86663 RepID=A0ABY9JYW4_9BACI|nr:DNA repair protein RecO [Bacillus carboniphilus]WLR43979.1 DNA repair protein RecO [Bacillus carboniphilus]
MIHKCEGYVVRSIKYGETNKIITIYSEQIGKVGLMARGANKPISRLSSLTQLFTYGSFLFHRSSKGLGTLEQGEIVHSMRDIREDLFLTAYASFFAELLDKATESNEVNRHLFHLFHSVLTYLNEGIDEEVLMFIYEMKMLYFLGQAPQLSCCANCGEKEGDYHFSIREGGLICHRCYDIDPYRFKISQKTVQLLRLFFFMDLARLGKVSLKVETKKELNNVIDEYYNEYTGIYLKSKQFIKQMEKMQGYMKED